MYQFNYQSIIPAGKPIITCVVPVAWLTKNLPTMGGQVVYVDKPGSTEALADYVFEFSEPPQENSQRTICLDLYHRDTRGDNLSSTHTRILEAPAKIHCRPIDENDANDGWCVEVVLLNHLFGSRASGLAEVKILDVILIVGWSTEFNLEFCVGETLSDILPGIHDPAAFSDARSALMMLFCRAEKMRLNYVDKAMNLMSTFYSNATCIFGDVGVDQDKMLVSVLIGH